MIINNKYVMIMKNQEVHDEIINLLHELYKVKGKDNINALITYMEEGGFFIDPASRKYHMSVKGGLARHTLSVYREALKIKDTHKTEIKIEDTELIVSCILHDLCKMGKYGIGTKNIKGTDGVWRQEPTYISKPKDQRDDFFGHGSGSVLRAMEFIGLTKNEKTAIINHMGTHGKSGEDLIETANALSTCKLAMVCHLADYTSSFLIEGGISPEMIRGLELLSEKEINNLLEVE